MKKKITTYIENLREEIIDDIIEISKIPALPPEVGGDGEEKKANFIKKRLYQLKPIEIIEINAPDLDVSSEYRPNILAKFKGKSSKKTFWIITHIDVEPPGDLSLWNGEPFDPHIVEGKIYARGAEDNNQDIIASLYALRTIKNLKYKPQYNVNLLFLSDEESGSRKGLKYFLQKAPELFKTDDYYLVTDGGSSKGLKIEIAEKGLICFKFQIVGKATHASTPHLGKNTLKVCAKIIKMFQSLSKTFSLQDSIFEPPYSTFEPTRKDQNVPHFNMIPGCDIFYLDCRILPDYSLEEVETEIKKITKQIEKEEKVKILISKPLEIHPAPKTPPDSPIVKKLTRSIKKVLKQNSSVIGVGFATLAAFLREKGFNVGVWRKVDNSAHKPNEYCVIDNAIIDCQVFTLALLEED